MGLFERILGNMMGGKLGGRHGGNSGNSCHAIAKRSDAESLAYFSGVGTSCLAAIDSGTVHAPRHCPACRDKANRPPSICPINLNSNCTRSVSY